ncbi:hypothetical protein TNCV_438561 [Trichonephila clavipes]|nr:hypothetical protein TNCV_438561 [Trichonephila clavipes]
MIRSIDNPHLRSFMMYASIKPFKHHAAAQMKMIELYKYRQRHRHNNKSACCESYDSQIPSQAIRTAIMSASRLPAERYIRLDTSGTLFRSGLHICEGDNADCNRRSKTAFCMEYSSNRALRPHYTARMFHNRIRANRLRLVLRGYVLSPG